jgi:hypothetical protein
MPAHEGGAARTAAGVRKPPMEEAAGRCGEVARQTLWGFGGCEREYNFCDMARTLRMGENAFRCSCNFREFVPHRSNKYFHVIASNGIVSSSHYIS